MQLSPQRQLPTKKINTLADVNVFLNSQAYKRITEFLEKVNTAVEGKPCFNEAKTPLILNILKIFDQMNTYIDEIPPQTNKQRYGNKSFRDYHARLASSIKSLHEQVFQNPELIRELIVYFSQSFGNETRIDYGSGHELSFICWLTIIDLVLGIDLTEVGLVLFPKYLQLVRRLQHVYQLEPAGSHGAWGLDDYHFIPFYWGSSQLIGHGVPDDALKSNLDQNYMYYSMISEIRATKKGEFHEHSKMLYDISIVPNWSKVNNGLLKMYKAEVLAKFPVIQHLSFGDVLPLIK